MSRDRTGAFVADVREAIDQILAAFGEPSVSSM
jgi:hypothetical protein